MAECESCKLTVLELKESIAGLKSELRVKDKLFLEFSTVTSAQAKRLSVLSSFGYGGGVLTCHDGWTTTGLYGDPTIPWLGSIIADAPVSMASSAHGKDLWLLSGAKPKESATLSSSHAPVETNLSVSESKPDALMCSTPRQPGALD